MLRLLFWCLLMLPIAELLVLIQVGQGLGFWPTLALLVVAGIAGLRLMRWQSARTLQRVASLGLATGAGASMLDALLVSAAGILLLFPGLISDALAVPLLLPPLRRALAAWLLGRGMVGMMGSFGETSIRFGSFGAAGSWRQARRPDQRDAFEGEFTRETPVNDQSLPTSRPVLPLADRERES